MKKLISISLFSAVLCICAALSDAALPQKINFQGQLTKTNGSPVTGSLAMTFTVYDALTAGTALKTITNSAVVFSDNGLYNVELDLTGINLNQELWLGITVGSDSEMSPRVPVLPSASSVFALNASNSDQLGGAAAASYLLKSGGTLTGPLNLGGYAVLISSSVEGLTRIKWADGSISTHAASCSGADMTKATYDTNSNNIIDNAERFGGDLPSLYLTKAVASTTYLALSVANTTYMKLSGGTFSGPITSAQSRLVISTNVYTVGYSSAAAFYGDGSNLTLGSSYGEMFMTANASASGISVISTPVKASGSTSSGELKNFTESGSNRLTYTGTKPSIFQCFISLTAFSTATNQTLTFSVAKNGSVIARSQIQSVLTVAADRANVTLACIVQLNTNDYIELFVANNTATNNITVSYMNANIVEIK